MKKLSKHSTPIVLSLSSLKNVAGGDGETFTARVKTSDKQQAAVLAFVKG